MEVTVTTGAIRRAKLQSKCHHRQTNTQFFYGTDVLPVAQQHCQSFVDSNQINQITLTEASQLYN